ncbi:minor capsid protein (plasmid) [Deinococcus sp. D7000]|nr:minor capsid protein [Deinococcus sp. D7000]QLG13520.1 minor capsid protein [Deinococcus sp. D7000]
MTPLSSAHRRLLRQAERQQAAHVTDARAAVNEQQSRLNLSDAQKALEAALSLPKAKRGPAVRETLTLIREASGQTRTPPPELLGVIRRAVSDRALNTVDLALLSDRSLVFGDTRELQARAVDRQRQSMNGYWAGEHKRFRDDASATVREAIRKGLDPEKAADLLQVRLGVHRSRAILIAVDQMLTAEARAEQSLLRAAGVKEFQWAALMDGKTRQRHAELNGQVFAWRAAPVLPGAEIRCRCRAIVPVSDEA